MRRLRSLAGKWKLQLDPDGKLNLEDLHPDREVTVPLPWQSEHPDLRQYTGYGWYKTTFFLEDGWLDGELLLRFGAVDYWCQVYVNGECVGEHEGGYTPFEFSIKAASQTGENTLAVRVYDAVETGYTIPRWWHDAQSLTTQPPFDAFNMPHGKQTWYVDVSGIWQDVTLHALPATYIRQMQVTPHIDGSVHAAVEIVNPQQGSLTFTLDGQTVRAQIEANTTHYTFGLNTANVVLWTPETPHLYTATVFLTTPAGEDKQETRVGFRELKAEKGKLWLNGEPFMLISALDQDIYPDTIYTPPSEAFLRDQFRKAKALGLNCLRCHIKPPDPLYLDLADEMGLLIWAEIPSWRTWHVKTTVHPAALHMDEILRERVRTTLREMIARDYNHPSLMIWTIVNEDWGTALLLSAEDRTFVREMYDLCKSLDPTRIVVDNSPCPAPWGYSPHVRTDINDFHIYTNIPDQAENFVSFVQNFALRPAWTFSLFGDGEPRGDEPLILSEFGNWGLPTLDNIGGGSEPEWFYLGAWWNPYDGEPSFPQGVEGRFQALGLNAIWTDFRSFAQATQWHQYNALKFEIEMMRREPNLAGYVITELSDIYWESNGLLDFARGEKVFHTQFAHINNEDVVVPRLDRYAFWDDEVDRVLVHASHYSSRDWSKATLHAQLDETHWETPVALPRGDTQYAGTFYGRFSSSDSTRYTSLRLHVEDAPGQRLAENETPLLVVPAQYRTAAYTQPIAVVNFFSQSEVAAPSMSTSPLTTTTASAGPEQTSPSPLEQPRAAPMVERDMISLGYRILPQITSDTRLLITSAPTEDLLAWVRAGGDMLLISPLSNPFFWQHARGGVYGGSWITTWSWLRPAVFKRLAAAGNPLGMPFAQIMPQTTLFGLPVYDERYHADFLAGQVGGWVRHPTVHTVQFRYGNGRIVLTTFRLGRMGITQPISGAMFHDLVDYITSDACQPTLAI
ncbi:MAG: glycoside hydrolase family 2 TIM barrel-domain containing protein [Chloroflexota bacterium]|nr:glycoside hydrolase family 2 TIM barrel-domain containing protein [Chloroflexota bacterium]